MARLPHEFYPGLEDLDEHEARRFAVSVLEAAEKHRGVELKMHTSGPNVDASVIAAVAARASWIEGL